MISEKNFKKILIAVLIIALIIVALIIIKPIIVSILWGLILAYIFYPIYIFLYRKIKERNITALLVVLLVIFILFLPIWFFFPLISKQIFDTYSYFQTLDFYNLIKKIIPSTTASPVFQAEAISLINNFISKIVSTILSAFSELILNLPNILLQAVVALFTFFFALRDGDKFKEYVSDISPFNKSLEKNISKEFKNITKAVIFGFIVTGIIQGIFT